MSLNPIEIGWAIGKIEQRCRQIWGKNLWIPPISVYIYNNSQIKFFEIKKKQFI